MELLTRLNSFINNENWSEFLEYLQPKMFSSSHSGTLVNVSLLARIAELLINENTPNHVKIVILKCLGNSCFNSYKHKEYDYSDDDKYSCKLYSSMAKGTMQSEGHLESNNTGTSDAYFPFQGVAMWATDYVISHMEQDDLSNIENEMLRLCVQFLCNLITFACKNTASSTIKNMPRCLNNMEFKNSIVRLCRSSHIPIARVACMFVHNALRDLNYDYFSDEQKKHLCRQLLHSTKGELASAQEAMLLLLRQPNALRTVYEDITIEDKLYILDTIYHELSESSLKLNDTNTDGILSRDAVEFLSERFRRRSDLVLKTIDNYLDGLEPTEIIILLDILGVLTSGYTELRDILQKDKSLLINCIYLLKSLHMTGKQSDNYFTPVQRLSEVAPSAQHISRKENASPAEGDSNKEGTKVGNMKNDIQSHPAFGFKAGLIRVIGNMSYRSKENQDLLREEDAIPLLLDCCNIDARNPLIMQWTILALRNLCEDNLENQAVVANSTKVGVVDNALIREMGYTLHEGEDGKSIGIVPLPREPKNS